MRACLNGHTDIARMLAGEFNANIDIQNTVRAISCASMSFGGGCECRRCRWYCHVSNFNIRDNAQYRTVAFVVMDAICYVNVLMVVVVVVVVVWWCRAWRCIGCVWGWSDVLLLYVGRVDIRLLCGLASMIILTSLACWRANSTPTSICKIR